MAANNNAAQPPVANPINPNPPARNAQLPLPLPSQSSSTLEDPFLPSVGLVFDSLSDFLRVKNAPVLYREDRFSISLWVHQLSGGHHAHNDHYLVIHVANNYALCFGNSHLQVAFRNEKPGWMWKRTTVNLIPGKWTFIAVTYDTTQETASVYVNGHNTDNIKIKGKLQPNQSQLIIKLLKISQDKDNKNNNHNNNQNQNNNQNNAINNDNNDNSTLPSNEVVPNCFSGIFSHIKLWGTVLNEAKLRQQMINRKEDPSVEALDQLLCWWPLNEGAGCNITDLMKNTPDGLISSESKWWMSASATGVKQPPASTLIADFKKMINNPLSSDVQLTVDGHLGMPIYCHKIILASRSESLSAMLTGLMTEAKQSVVTLQGMSYQTLFQLIEFLYTDNTTLSELNVIELFEASDQYQILRLRAMCEDYFLQNLDVDNVCGVVSLADRTNASHLRQFCINWIVSNFGTILKREDYRNLPNELVREIDAYAAEMYFNNKDIPSSSNNKKKRRAQG